LSACLCDSSQDVDPCWPGWVWISR
jgi:hypothetical protein